MEERKEIKVAVQYEYGYSYSVCFFLETVESLEKKWKDLSDLSRMDWIDERIFRISVKEDYEECIIVSRMYRLIKESREIIISEDDFYLEADGSCYIHAHGLDDSWIRTTKGERIPLVRPGQKTYFM
jgi:hypothetical protein